MSANTCILYVDYEGLLVELSHTQFFTIEQILDGLLKKAQQRFLVQRAIVLGDWTYHNSRQHLEERGFTCRTLAASNLDIDQILCSGIAESITEHTAADIYILVSGTTNLNSVLHLLRQEDRTSLLWTLTPPSAEEQALCSSWELLTTPKIHTHIFWPRSVILQAIAIAADHLQGGNNETAFLLSHLATHLRQFPSFQNQANTWLAIALHEQLLFQQEPENGLDEPYGYLNHQHALVRKALLIRERILVTLGNMLNEHEWVAFGALESSLRTSQLLADSKQARHAWIELLLAENILIARQIPSLTGFHPVTALSFNPTHPLTATLERHQEQQLICLIVVVYTFTIQKDSSWMAIARVLKVLTGDTTRIEARATLQRAAQRQIVSIGSLPSKNRPPELVATLRLQAEQPLVQETIKRLQQLILLTDLLLGSRSTNVSIAVLTEEFMRKTLLSKSVVQFWVELLLQVDILVLKSVPAHSGNFAHLITLSEQSRLVDQVLARNRQ